MGADGAQVLVLRRLSLLLGLLVVAGCGGAVATEPPPSPADVVMRAADKMAEAGSARFTVDGTVLAKDVASKGLPFGVKGITRFDGKQAWIWLDMSSIFPAVAASALPRGQREDVRRLLEDPKGWQAEYRVRGKTTWVRLPALTDLYGVKPWIKLANEAGKTGVEAIAGETGTAFIEPSALIVYLRALTGVKEVARDDGLTHYRGFVQLDRLPALVPKKERAETKRRIRQVISQTGTRKLPLDVWVDDAGVARRFRILEISPREGTDKYPTRWHATMDVLEYGVPVDVLRPPAGQVITSQEFDRITGT